MTRFERYPGPPGEGSDLHRVISPWRDALAWVSIAGHLRVAQYLIRDGDGDGWRPARSPVGDDLLAGNVVPPLPSPDADATAPTSVWELHHRDPVELVFACILPGVTATASVTVDRTACDVVLDVRNPGGRPAGIATLVDIEGAWVTWRDGVVLIRFPARVSPSS